MRAAARFRLPCDARTQSKSVTSRGIIRRSTAKNQVGPRILRPIAIGQRIQKGGMIEDERSSLCWPIPFSGGHKVVAVCDAEFGVA